MPTRGPELPPGVLRCHHTLGLLSQAYPRLFSPFTPCPWLITHPKLILLANLITSCYNGCPAAISLKLYVIQLHYHDRDDGNLSGKRVHNILHYP